VTVDFERRGRCGVITINRPEARNAVNAEVAAGIEAGIDRIENDDELWVGILTGVAPVFCAGADLKEVQWGRGDGVFTRRGGFGGFVTRARAKPVIAAVDGPALAGGAELVLAADLVVASRRAAFGIPEVKRCLIAGAGGLFRLARKIPENVAMECALTGDPISAERAQRVGLVNELVEDGRAVEAALALAGRIIAARAGGSCWPRVASPTRSRSPSRTRRCPASRTPPTSAKAWRPSLRSDRPSGAGTRHSPPRLRQAESTGKGAAGENDGLPEGASGSLRPA
jgi:enoyl-CoA hydratase